MQAKRPFTADFDAQSFIDNVDLVNAELANAKATISLLTANFDGTLGSGQFQSAPGIVLQAITDLGGKLERIAAAIDAMTDIHASERQALSKAA